MIDPLEAVEDEYGHNKDAAVDHPHTMLVELCRRDEVEKKQESYRHANGGHDDVKDSQALKQRKHRHPRELLEDADQCRLVVVPKGRHGEDQQ